MYFILNDTFHTVPSFKVEGTCKVIPLCLALTHLCGEKMAFIMSHNGDTKHYIELSTLDSMHQ